MLRTLDRPQGDRVLPTPHLHAAVREEVGPLRLHRAPEAASPQLKPRPAFEYDGNELVSEIERVRSLQHGVRQRATSGGANSHVGRTRHQVKRVAIPLTVRPYQVAAIPGRGLGLTACSIIDRRTKIDDCFTWELPKRDIKHVTETVLNGNYFDHPLCSQRGLVAIGHISLINHDPEPNCEWRMVQVHDRWMIEAWSICRLSSGEELTFDYGYDPTDKG
ncbi:MAG: SET domain-containing protein [Reyranella sp.]|nr:MAG: SET domain-containing protein [Reyranella sp.]